MVTTTHRVNYKVVTLAQDEHHHVDVPPEGVTDTVFDQSASGAYVTLTTTGGDIRNVGVKGTSDGFGHGGHFHITVDNDDGDYTTIDHVYIGDGLVTNASDEGYVGGIRTLDSHAGDVQIRNCNIRRMSEGGIMTAAPGSGAGAGGRSFVDNCVTAHCCLAGIAFGADGSYAKGCTIYNDGTGPISHDGTTTRQGALVQYTDIGLTELDIEIPSADGPAVTTSDGGHAYLFDCAINGDITGTVTQYDTTGSPDMSIPRGVPATAEAAAAGSTVSSFTITHDGQKWPVAAYKPSTVAYPALRTEMPWGETRAFALTEPKDQPDRAFRIHTPEGPKAIALGDPVIDGFEYGPSGWPSDWVGNTGGFEVTTDFIIDGQYSLKSTTNFPSIGHTGVTTPRGATYSTRVETRSTQGATDPRPWFLTNVQNASSPVDDAYYVSLNIQNDQLSVGERNGGSTAQSYSAATSESLGTDVPYRLFLRPGETTITGWLTRADTGAELARASFDDSTLTGGTVGLYAGGSDGIPTYFDSVKQHGPPVGAATTADTEIDTFESGSLADYTTDDTSAFDAQSSTVYEGSYALRVNANNGATDGLWSMPGDGLPHYPAVGDEFRYYFKTLATSSFTDVTMYFGKQTDDANNNQTYSVTYQSEGNFIIREIDSNNSSIWLQQADVTYTTDTWFRVDIGWPDATTLTATLTNAETDTEVVSLTGTPSLGFTNGGVLFQNQYNRNGHVYYDGVVKTN